MNSKTIKTTLAVLMTQLISCAQTFTALPGLAGTNTAANHLASATNQFAGYVADDKYKLRAGDRISLQIMEDREAPKSLLVTDSGEVDVPYLGRIVASEKTCRQLRDLLKEQFEKEYYHRATVVIAVDVVNKFFGRIYIWGQVRNQGPIDLAPNENLTVAKAILRAGGFADFANKKRVKIIRNAAEDGVGKQVFELNLAEILDRGLIERDIVLRPDDLIIVPSRLVNF